MSAVQASTTVTGVIGDPIAHSLSPAIHNAAFDAVGLDWVYVALPVAAGNATAAVNGMRALGIRGLSVTMPHKAEVIAALDDLDDDARALGAVNCITRRGSELVGHNTDGPGFLAALQADFGFDPAGRSCVVLGAGGAARAVIRSLAGAGAASVQVVNRTASSATTAAAMGGAVGAVADARAVRGADLVVNATPVGMGDAQLPCDPELIGSGQVVAELIYHPPTTPLMLAARGQGALTTNGLSMLVHQAAIAFERWTGVRAPLEAMQRAATAGIELPSEDEIAKS